MLHLLAITVSVFMVVGGCVKKSSSQAQDNASLEQPRNENEELNTTLTDNFFDFILHHKEGSQPEGRTPQVRVVVSENAFNALHKPEVDHLINAIESSKEVELLDTYGLFLKEDLPAGTNQDPGSESQLLFRENPLEPINGPIRGSLPSDSKADYTLLIFSMIESFWNQAETYTFLKARSEESQLIVGHFIPSWMEKRTNFDALPDLQVLIPHFGAAHSGVFRGMTFGEPYLYDIENLTVKKPIIDSESKGVPSADSIEAMVPPLGDSIRVPVVSGISRRPYFTLSMLLRKKADEWVVEEDEQEEFMEPSSEYAQLESVTVEGVFSPGRDISWTEMQKILELKSQQGQNAEETGTERFHIFEDTASPVSISLAALLAAHPNPKVSHLLKLPQAFGIPNVSKSNFNEVIHGGLLEKGIGNNFKVGTQIEDFALPFAEEIRPLLLDKLSPSDRDKVLELSEQGSL